jgi:hypothetical protein
MQQHDVPANPCINICRMDQQAQFCQGCMRTLAEIGLWDRMTAQERIDLAAQLERRRAAKAGRAA